MQNPNPGWGSSPIHTHRGGRHAPPSKGPSRLPKGPGPGPNAAVQNIAKAPTCASWLTLMLLTLPEGTEGAADIPIGLHTLQKTSKYTIDVFRLEYNYFI